MILRDDKAQDGGSGELKQVAAPEIKPGKGPENVEKMPDFIADFEVEQLPPHSQGLVEEKKKEESKPEEKKLEEKKETSPTEKKQEEKVEKREEKQPENPLLKILKPPGGEKKQEEGQKEGEKKPEHKPLMPPQSRDLSGYTPQEAALLKQMSNEAFEYTSKMLKENKELQKLRDTTYLQHEHGYLLDPTYNNLRLDVTYAIKEAKYWESQLLAIQEGKTWKMIERWDENGNPVLSGELPPSKADEEKVRLAMNNCYSAASGVQAKLTQYPNQYKAAITNDLQVIQNYRRQQFGWVADPKLMEHSININGLGDRTLAQIRDDIKSLLPVYMRSHPLAEVLGDLAIAIRIQEAQLSEKTNGKVVEDILEKELEKKEPSSHEKPTPTKDAIHGVSEFVIDPSLGV